MLPGAATGDLDRMLAEARTARRSGEIVEAWREFSAIQPVPWYSM